MMCCYYLVSKRQNQKFVAHILLILKSDQESQEQSWIVTQRTWSVAEKLRDAYNVFLRKTVSKYDQLSRYKCEQNIRFFVVVSYLGLKKA